MRCLFLISLLALSYFAIAQDFAAEKEIQVIDSLIQSRQLTTAQRKTDSLYKQLALQKTGEQKAQLLELKYRQALIIDRQEESPAESLKILIDMIDEVEAARLYSLSYHVYLLMALCYEKSDNLELTRDYLKKAYKVYEEHNLESIYSTYCIRISSYYRFTNNLDSMLYYAKKANVFAQKYGNEKDLADSYLLLGAAASSDKNYIETLGYYLKLLNLEKKNGDTLSIFVYYNNIAQTYLKMGNTNKALQYSDSSIVFKTSNLSYNSSFFKIRSKIYEALGNKDSSYYNLKQHVDCYQQWAGENEKVKTKKLEEQYQNDKNEAIIRNKEQQLIFIGSLLAVIAVASVLIIIKNRQINEQNKVIRTQLAELSKTLEQKQVLLSEFQHRVKNNLQHVISILEIQKESADFNNIEELIRGNQNRIHSMALLHKKLSVTDNVNDVDLKIYISELAELVKDSYDNIKKKVSLHVKCEIETISIEKALPIGLIITELVSNSMKYAFEKQKIGIISIEITKNETGNQIYYADNGVGFDFYKVNEKGLGLEIIKGLIDQLGGNVEAKRNNGFELTICFK
ncbi:MAG: tetratricopeptide repeat protein [Bacteroidetes bacterium]|jgi:two-component sensor histidine kinase|nr:tetratricopeptide repeat protein [Bacteroidota bacterium]